MWQLFLLVLSVVVIVWLTGKLKIHPFLALIGTAVGYGLLSGMPAEQVVANVNTGFGKTIGGIGPVILFGVMIGIFLERSGGAYVMAEKVMKILGRKRVTEGMAASGYIVSIPVFADSGFMLLSPLNKALTSKAGQSIIVTGVALAMGLLASHCMVPPTPGPIYAAGVLNADLGWVILLGSAVSIASLVPALTYVKHVGNKLAAAEQQTSEEHETPSYQDAPAAGMAFLPIVIPIALIVAKSIVGQTVEASQALPIQIINFLGTPVIALMIGLLIALKLPKNFDKTMLSTTGWVGQAINSAGSIIIITGAGGVFGMMLRESGIADQIQSLIGDANLGILLPFIIAAAIKTAQGSSTVSILVTSGIIAPLMPFLGLESDLEVALTVVALGAGSAMVSHANDSFFWVVTQMTGMNVTTGYKVHTVASGIVGLSAGILIFVLSMLL